MKSLVVIVVAALIPFIIAWDNEMALTPFMGWNSWNHWKCAMNESVIRDTAAALRNSGMAAVGYTYVSLDDCWVLPKRDSQNRPVADPAKFPSGIKALADRVHDLGLKFGIYSDAGTSTCIYPGVGSLGYEQIDADTYAEWTADLLK
jgi:alpha-galactosidase